MAVDSATISTASGILKEDYLPGVRDQLNAVGPVFAELKKTSKDIIQGKYTVFAARMGVSQAIGSRAELGTLPAAQRSLHAQAQATLKYIYGVIRVSGPFMESSKTDKAAFVRGLRSEVDGITEAMKLDLSRQVFSDGTGTLATCAVNTATRAIILAVGTNMKNFEVGMLVDFKDNAGAALTDGTAREVISIDVANRTINLDTGGNVITTAATDLVYRASSKDNEISGLDKIVDSTGALYALNPSTAGYERWAATEVATFGAFTIGKLQEQLDAVHDNSGEWINMLVSQSGPRNKYLSELQAQRHFLAQQAPTKLNGGFTGLAYTGGGREAVWVKDHYCQNSRIYGLNMDQFEFRRTKDFEFVEINGETWIPDISGSSGVDAYKAVLCTYAELITFKRNAHMKLLAVS